MTKLYFLNYFILQLFFIRLTRHTQKVKYLYIDYGLNSCVKFRFEKWYSIQYWVIPFTGWNTDFKYLNGKASFLPLSKPKTIK